MDGFIIRQGPHFLRSGGVILWGWWELFVDADVAVDKDYEGGEDGHLDDEEVERNGGHEVVRGDEDAESEEDGRDEGQFHDEVDFHHPRDAIGWVLHMYIKFA